MWLINLLKLFSWSWKIIPDRTDPAEKYLTRWYLIGGAKHRWFTAALHEFHRSDPTDLHSHPFAYLSIVLKGGYWEHLKSGSKKWRGWGHISFHLPSYLHRIELNPEKPRVYTLFLMGPRWRDWGFVRHGHWITHEVYLRALTLKAKRAELLLKKSKEAPCKSPVILKQTVSSKK